MKVARDQDADEKLASAGWQVLRIWEHEDTNQDVDRILAALRSSGTPPR